MNALMGVDLAETLRNIVKLKVNNYQEDIVYDILNLYNSKDNDYFCFMTRDSGTWLFKEKEAYIKESQANNTWKYYKDSKGIFTYMIEVTEKKENKIIGNIYEVDYKKTLDDIIKNEQEIEKVEVTFENENKLIYDVEDFRNNKADIINKYGEIKGSKDLIKDYFFFNVHLSKIKSQRQNNSKPIKSNDYLEIINNKKLNKLGYKKNDMYYVSSTDCRKILNQTNINVYLLQGNEKIRIDKPVSDYEKPVYGIWIEDKKRYDSFDKKELNYLIRVHINEKVKKEKLRNFGYKDNDIYLLDSNKEIKSAFNKNLDIYSLDKNFRKTILTDMKDISESIDKGNIIVIDYHNKDEIIGSLQEYNHSNYIDILDKKEVETIINMQINEATYFDRIKEEEGKYLVKNIDNIAETLIKDYDPNINISDRVDYLIKNKLNNRDIVDIKKEVTFKDRIQKAKEKSMLNNKDNNLKQNEIER